MSQIPNFAKVDFAESTAPAGKTTAAPWTTPEGIVVKPTYSEHGVHLAAFVHVPPVTRKVLRPSKKHRASLDDLSRAAACFLLATTTIARRMRRHV